jgi:hypothetical protein
MRADHRRMVEEMRTAFDEADKAKEAAFAELEDKMRHDPSRQSLAETLPKAIQAWHEFLRTRWAVLWVVTSVDRRLCVSAACSVRRGIGSRRCWRFRAQGSGSSGVRWCGTHALPAQVLESVEQGYRQLHRDLSDRAAQYVETIGNEVLEYSSTRL